MESVLNIKTLNIPFLIGLCIISYILLKLIYSTAPIFDKSNIPFPHIPKSEMKQLMDVYPSWHKETNLHPIKPKDVFPDSPVMPDLNVINGVAPYNPDFAGKEWANAGMVASNPQTPFPLTIPIPTMFPSPKNIKVLENERFRTFDEKDEYNGFTNQKYIIEGEFDKNIDGEMSRWTQFSPCVNNVQERTRTCVHNGISGGKSCGHTIEKRKC